MPWQPRREAATWSGAVFTPARVTLRREYDVGAELARTVYEFDPFGRLAKETRLMPDAVEAERTIEYDAAGRRKRVQEWGTSGSPGGFTDFTYEEFGRPETITAPDGTVTSFAYAGASRVDRTVSVQGAGAVTVRELYDRFGRLTGMERKRRPQNFSRQS
jgi:YD repeat-containing protein